MTPIRPEPASDYLKALWAAEQRRMKCSRRNCKSRERIERFAPGIFLCAEHRQAILNASRAYEQRAAVNRKVVAQEAHEVAEQVAGMSKPPRYKLTQGWTIYELNGGLPSLGKDAR